MEEFRQKDAEKVQVITPWPTHPPQLLWQLFGTSDRFASLPWEDSPGRFDDAVRGPGGFHSHGATPIAGWF